MTADNFPKAVPDGGSYESTTAPWPVELRVFKEEGRLEIDFSDGHACSLTAEYLRVESPSAEVQGHSPSQKQTIGGKRAVGIRKIEPVGNYAVRLVFDDMHDTGIYSWRYLHELGREQDKRWAGYLAALSAKNLAR